MIADRVGVGARMRGVLLALGIAAVSALQPVAARAADLDAARVRAALAAATPGHPADFAAKSLRNLDLSHLDFAGADLAHADLFGAKLEGANFTGANLSGANLNLAWIIRANFTGADLSGASLVGPVVSMGLQQKPDEAPKFPGANFAKARVIARLGGDDLRGARFVGARMGADMHNQSMGLMRADLSSANLAGADFTGADLGHALFRFADLRGAKLVRASLVDADLSGADLTGADLTGADATGAIFDQAVLTGALGLDAVKGFAR